MWDKTKIFNLALSALFLQKRISNSETDTSTEALTLNNLWDTSFQIMLQEMDLDSTAMTADLELLEVDPNEDWTYAYRYPVNCAFLRRIESGVITDDEETSVDRKVQMLDGVKVIFTDKQNARAEFIPYDINIGDLNAEAVLCISLRLAQSAAPLIVGKNSENVIRSIEMRYEKAIIEAKRKDASETSIYQPEWMRSTLVKARLS
jgi:hypothetical protein